MTGHYCSAVRHGSGSRLTEALACARESGLGRKLLEARQDPGDETCDLSETQGCV